MIQSTRHKVFISFQHGCEDEIHQCGKQILRLPLGSVTSFIDCSGSCGRNRINPLISNSKCRYYFKCGHYWKSRFENLMSGYTEKMISKAVSEGDINVNNSTETIRQIIRDEFISDASVTVVLIGPETWKRKHVDWEISSSIKDTKNNPRCGLIGILLPTHPSYNQPTYNQYIIPPRLYYNDLCGFAKIYNWTEDTTSIQNMIHNAFERRDKYKIDNSYPSFAKNRSIDQTSWQS